MYSRGFIFTESKLGELASDRDLENKMEPCACGFLFLFLFLFFFKKKAKNSSYQPLYSSLNTQP